MFGFIVGTLSLIGFIKVWRGGRFGRGGYGKGRRRWLLRRLFERLDATPGQEKVMAAAADEVERAAYRVRDEALRARAAYSRAMRGEAFDAAAVNEALEAQQGAVEGLKKAVRDGLQSTHEALTPGQRAVLSDLIEFGPGALRGGCTAYRGHAGHGPAVHA